MEDLPIMKGLESPNNLNKYVNFHDCLSILSDPDLSFDSKSADKVTIKAKLQLAILKYEIFLTFEPI